MAINMLRKGSKAASISFIICFILALVKGLVAFITGSVVLLSDALHSGADMVVMLASWFGLKIAERKPSEKFPYGYYKAESLATMFISFFILYSSINLLKEGYERLFLVPKIHMPALALFAASLSFITSFIISRYLMRTGREINSQLLVTSSKERLMDAVSSAVVFVAILLSYYRVLYAEGIVTILISLMILKIGLSAVKDSVFALMDVSPSKESEEIIKRIIKSTRGVVGFNNLRLRKSGPFIFGEVSIKVKEFINVEKAHEIADEIEERIKKRLNIVDSFIVHIEPYKGEKHKIAIPIEKPMGMGSRVTKFFGRSKFFLFVTTDKKNISGFYSKRNPFSEKQIRAGLATAHFLIKENVDVLVTKEIGEISFHTLRDHLVDIYKIKGETAGEVVNNFLNNNLIRLKKPTQRKE
ncbi:MAG: hypothetical protein DRP03_01650 [Candidatus Aenigmatarchaeota archaeon]|nr:MAG: hypothetical protein DRP03_01650 [Candidatus Aenigmarchaeota archaeon]